MKHLILLAVVLLSFQSKAIVIRVDIDASGANDGTSWVNAYEDLQDALAVAVSGDNIWVAAGVYKPTSTTNEDISFEIPGGVNLYGGFVGTEVFLAQRNWLLNPTILSGAIGLLNSITDNSNTVVKVHNEVGLVLLDGFHVRRAYYGISSGGGSPISITDSEVTIRHCEIYDNDCYGSAGLYTCAGTVTIDNCLFHDNHDPAPTDGILIANLCSSTLTIIETTITNNTFTDPDPLVINDTSTPILNLYNSILWDNGSGAIDTNMVVTASNCIIQGGYVGTEIFDIDPLFTDPGLDDYSLQLASVARNGGDDSFSNLNYDLSRAARINDGTVDMGCYEVQADGVIYVDDSATGANNGSSWVNAYTDLQSALAVAVAGVEIWVDDGTYKPTSGNSRSTKFVVPPGVRLYGGFGGFETQRNQRDWDLFPTILSGAIGTNADTDNSYIILSSSDADGIVIDGFDIKKAYHENLTGAAISLINGSATIKHCKVHDNFAQTGSAINAGGGLSTLTIEECLFFDNESSLGDVFTTGASNTIFQFINCTISRNWSPAGEVFGGQSNRTFIFHNSIIWDHVDPLFESLSNVDVYSCILQDFDPLVLSDYSNVVDLDPKFTDPDNDDFTILLNSPAHNSGNNDLSTSAKDLASNARIFEDIVDMGSYENDTPSIYFVDVNATGLNNGTNWTDAYTDLQEAMLNCVEGQQIWVADGTYKPTSTNSRLASFVPKNNVPVYGGFAGGELSIEDRDYQAHLTILSGNIGNSGIDTDNSYHIVRVNDSEANIEMDGFVIIDGYANFGPGNDDNGSAVLIENANRFTMRNSWLNNNYCASHTVWAVFTAEGSFFTNSVFQDNTVDNLGAAVGYNTDVYFENCAFLHNSGIQGIVFQNDASAELDMRGCTFFDNDINTTQSSYCIVKGVTSNNVLKGQVVNTVIWGNDLHASAKAIDGGTTTLFDVNFCILQGVTLSGSTTGENVFYEDPLFVNTLAGDFTLQVGSKGLNGGENSFVTTSLDALQELRIQKINVDMGCVESSACSRSNDHCFRAIEIVVDAPALLESDECATTNGELAGTCSAAIGRSVWYTFNAEPGMIYEILIENVTPISNPFNPKLEFFSGDCQALTQLACVNANGNSLGEVLVVDTLSSVLNYFIRVSGGTLQSGTFEISVTATSSCVGDFDNSGAIGIADLLIFNAAYGCPSNCGPADLDGDGSVGVTDLLIFNSVFGTTCP